MNILDTNNALCRQCYACVRACPVNAISFQNGKITIAKEDCILCGSCARVCSQGAKVLFNDIPMVQQWLAEGKPTAAVVAPSAPAAFDCSPYQLIAALRRLGFSLVLETAFGAEICAHEYQKLLDAGGRKPIISSACPAVVMMVEKHFPQLTDCLAPVKSPMLITGEWVKKKQPQCKTVFIGPCIAKKAESLRKDSGNSIDAVITFRQLKEWFDSNRYYLEKMPEEDWDTPGANTARLFPLAGGLLKTLDLHQDVSSLDIIEAHGPVKCKSILQSVISGALTPKIVDLLCCDGCINGLEIASSKLCFVKHKTIIDYADKNKKENKNCHHFASYADGIDAGRTFIKRKRIKELFTEKQIWSVLKKSGKKHEKDLLNCGACGFDTCWDKAIAVLQGKADPLMCLPYLLQQYKELNNQLTAMFMLSRSLEYKAATDRLTGLYNHRRFQEQLQKQIKISRSRNQSFALFIIDIDNFKQINDLYGHEAGDLVLVEIASLIRELFKNGFAARYAGEEFAVIQPGIQPKKALEMGRRLCQIVKQHRYKITGNNLNPELTVSAGIACFPVNATNKDDLLKLAGYALQKAQTRKNQAVLYSSVLDDLSPGGLGHEEDEISTIKTLNIVINAKDSYTYKHSERVVHYAETLARQLTLPEKEIKYLKYGAFLHDIGKISIDMSILQKPGSLNDEEFQIIKKHPLTGAEIIKEIPSLHKAVPVVLYHHERYDGKGYPYGIKGNNIPLFGRIAAVADSFDAMTTNRPYKKALNYHQAVNELLKNSGSQFDPEMVKCFISSVKEIAAL
ncbi:MAG: diguanylate cyclase [Desulfotomaculum sp.]|nr:diguanylate cyclase [Desulfotomaculum sp.]